MIKLTSLFKAPATTIMTAEISHDTLLSFSVLQIMDKMNEKIASHMARIYIKHRRDAIERFVVHPATQKRIAREVRKLLEKTLQEPGKGA